MNILSADKYDPAWIATLPEHTTIEMAPPTPTSLHTSNTITYWLPSTYSIARLGSHAGNFEFDIFVYEDSLFYLKFFNYIEEAVRIRGITR